MNLTIDDENAEEEKEKGTEVQEEIEVLQEIAAETEIAEIVAEIAMEEEDVEMTAETQEMAEIVGIVGITSAVEATTKKEVVIENAKIGMT